MPTNAPDKLPPGPELGTLTAQRVARLITNVWKIVIYSFWFGVLSCSVPKPLGVHTPSPLGKGTLVVFTKTQDGLLVCADKRLTYGPNDYRDDSTKLAQIGSKLAFAVVGVPYIEVSDGSLTYNAISVVKNYFATTVFEDSRPFWDGLNQRLVDSFMAYLRPRAYEAWPPTQFPEAEYSFTQILFVFPDKDRQLQIKYTQLRYIKQLKPFVDARTRGVRLKGLYDSLGWSKLDGELKRGKDRRFDDLRQEVALRPFLTNEIPETKVKVDQALIFAKRLIEVSNKRSTELGDSPEDIGIGLSCDCVLVSPTSDVTWVAQNLSVEK